MIIGPESCDNSPIGFGKYAKLTPEQVADLDPQYIVWMYENVGIHPISEALYKRTVASLNRHDEEDEDEDEEFEDTYTRFMRD